MSAPISSRVIGLPQRDLRSDDREALETFDLVREAADDPVLVGGKFAFPARAPSSSSAFASKIRFGSPFSSTSVVDSTVLPRLRKKREPERVVLARPSVLAELDVEGDSRRLPLRDPVEQPRVQRPRERPACVRLVERDVVDFDTITTSGGAAWSPRKEKRRSTVCRSRFSRKRKWRAYADRRREDRAQGDEEEEIRAKAHLPRIHGLEDG